MYTSVVLTELQIRRRIWIYLPDDYAYSEKRYPVLYMQDGQNLFDVTTSYSGEWNIDEYLDTVEDACIVIGIDNAGDKRMHEYNPEDPVGYGRMNGRTYLDLIVKLLKPYVDEHFRTIPDQANTFIAGSSMGGLISFYAGLLYPDIFGGIGVLSPSFWLIPDLAGDIKARTSALHQFQRYFFYAGMKEGENLVDGIQVAANHMEEYGGCEVKLVIEEKGKHSESSWRKIFPVFYQWLMKGSSAPGS
ncbi:MAG TPA: alpha/beta hydrolase-fold protein [Chitinophagaceae bacterium]|nr:alpha/beta hydrolase-fold protein [Chitinophagaceae bacterium]